MVARECIRLRCQDLENLLDKIQTVERIAVKFAPALKE